MLSELEKRIIAAVQGDIAVAQQPYQKMAHGLGLSETELLERLADLCHRGVIRRFGATLRHQKTGFAANAMVAWQVDEARVEEVGRLMAGFRQVSHCYRRNPTHDWPFNLYTMVHARSEEGCRKIAHKMSDKTGVIGYSLLFSRRELKKTSMQYFPDNGEVNGFED